MSSEQTNEYAIQLPGAFFNHAAAARSERIAARQAKLLRRQLFRAMDHFRALARSNHTARKQVETFIEKVETELLTALFSVGSPTLAPAQHQAGFLEAMAVHRAFFGRDAKAGRVRRGVLAAVAGNPTSQEVLRMLSPEAMSYVQYQFKMLHDLRQLNWVESAF